MVTPRRRGQSIAMRISAKVDYAVRAAVQLAAADGDRPTKGDTIAQAQGIPLKFLENILSDLRHAGLVRSQRGAEGGYWLNRPAAEISVADVIRGVEGPLASVRGQRREDIAYAGPARGPRTSPTRARPEPLQTVWIAVRASLRSVAEHVTLADIAAGALPAHVTTLASDPHAWVTRRGAVATPRASGRSPRRSRAGGPTRCRRGAAR